MKMELNDTHLLNFDWREDIEEEEEEEEGRRRDGMIQMISNASKWRHPGLNQPRTEIINITEVWHFDISPHCK